MEITPRAEEEGVRGPSSSSSFRHWPGRRATRAEAAPKIGLSAKRRACAAYEPATEEDRGGTEWGRGTDGRNERASTSSLWRPRRLSPPPFCSALISSFPSWRVSDEESGWGRGKRTKLSHRAPLLPASPFLLSEEKKNHTQ